MEAEKLLITFASSSINLILNWVYWWLLVSTRFTKAGRDYFPILPPSSTNINFPTFIVGKLEKSKKRDILENPLLSSWGIVKYEAYKSE